MQSFLTTDNPPRITEDLIRQCFKFGWGYKMNVFIGNNYYDQTGVTIRVKDREGNDVIIIDDIDGDDYGFVLDECSKTIEGKEVRVKKRYRRSGLGKKYVEGRVRLARALGISKIINTAGREDGAYFWSRHGWRLLDEAQRKKFKCSILKNLNAAESAVFTRKMKRRIQTVLDEDSLFINQKISYLGLSQKQIKILFFDAGTRMVLDLNCAQSMKVLNAALSKKFTRNRAEVAYG